MKDKRGVSIELERKIKVAHIITRMIMGGSEENTLFTVEGLDKERYELDLIVGEEFRENILNNIKEKNFKIIQVKGLKAPFNPLHDLITLFELIKLLKRGNYDIVHTHATKTGILGRIAARVTKVPIIIHGLHGSAFKAFDSRMLNWALIFFERLTGKFTDAYISVSDILSKKYIEEGLGRNARYFTIYSGMNLDKFYNARKRIAREVKLSELGIDSKNFVIGNVGRLEAVKGHKYLIDAFKKINEERQLIPLKLLIIGDGVEKDNLENYVKELNLKTKVIFAGYREDVEELMAIMDIFVLSSLREGLPRVLVQAAAVGIPLIAFNVDGVPEIVKDNYNGFLVRPKDVAQLANSIIRYVDNKEIINLYGQRGREFVKGKWSIKDMVDKIDKIYQSLVERKIKK